MKLIQPGCSVICRSLLLVLSLWLAGCGGKAVDSDYQKEVTRLEARLEELRPQQPEQASEEDWLRFTSVLYARSGLTADYHHFAETEQQLKAALQRFPRSAELHMLMANLDFKLHRLGAATEQLSGMPALPQVAVLQADLLLQTGHYREAELAYEQLAEQHPGWDNLARLAYYYSNTGREAEADALYVRAQEKLNVKQMRHFAWLELQRGIIDLDHGRYDAAREHFELADQAFSGYWLIEEHLAEVRFLQGDSRASKKLYGEVLNTRPAPEFVAALAAVEKAEGDQSAVERLYQEADRLFTEQYGLFPEAALGHYIDFLSVRDQVDESQLLKLALDNHQLRPNALSKLQLLKVYERLGDSAKARQLAEEIWQTPWRTREIEKWHHQLVQAGGVGHQG